MSCFKKYTLIAAASMLSFGAVAGFAVSSTIEDVASQVGATISSTSNADGSVTVSCDSFSATSGSLDSNISYSSAKGSAGTAPAASGGSVRIYQGGGIFTVSAKNSAVISSIVMASGQGTTVTYSVDGGTASSGTSMTQGTNTTFSSLNASSSVAFTCTGTSSKNRLYVSYLAVTYSLPSAKTLTSITAELKDNTKTWYVGDTVTTSDIKVTANFDDSSTTNPTTGYTLSDNTLTSNENQVGVSYTYGSVTKTASVDVSAVVPTVVTGLTLSETEKALETGGSFDLSGTIAPEDATNKGINWTISNSGSAVSLSKTSTSSGEAITVSAGTAEGTATITATAAGDSSITKTCTVTVSKPQPKHAGTFADPYTVEDAILVADNGGSGDTEYCVKGIITSLEWSSTYSDYKNVYVSDDGTTTSTFEFFNFYACATSAAFPGDILETGMTIVGKGKITKYNSTCEFQKGCYWVDTLESVSVSGAKTTGWTTDDTISVTSLGATVTAHYSVVGDINVTAYAKLDKTSLVAGDNTINVSFTSPCETSVSKSDSVVLTDVKVPVTSVSISAASGKTQIDINEELQLTATVNPENATVKSVTWESSNESVATVSSTGLVTGVAVGQATISATCDGKVGEYNVTVYDSNIYVDTLVISGTLTKSNYYTGETFDASGLTVKGVMNDTDKTQIDVTSDVSWTPSILNTAGDNIQVTANYTNSKEQVVTAKVSVKVVEKAVDSIAVTTMPDKTEYIVGDDFDPAGLVVTATYPLGDEVVTAYTLSTPDMSTHGTKTITVTFGGKTTSFEIVVNKTPLKFKVGVPEGYEKCSSLAAGDQVIFVSEDCSSYLSGLQTKYGDIASYSSQSDWSGAKVFTIEENNGKYAFKTGNLYIYASSTATDLKNQTAAFYWSVSFSSAGKALVKASASASRQIVARTGTSARWANYTASSIDGSEYYGIELYKKVGGYEEKTAGTALRSFIENVTDNLMVCDSTGVYSSIYWATIRSKFQALSESDKSDLKYGVAKDTANGGNILENFLSTYDFLVNNKYYDYDDFIGRGASSGASGLFGNNSVGVDSGSAMIAIATIGGISIASAMMLAKRRKEN